MGAFVHRVPQPNNVEKFLSARRSGGLLHSLQAKSELNVLNSGKPGEQGGVLKHQRHLARYNNVPLRGLIKPSNDIEEGRFPAA